MQALFPKNLSSDFKNILVLSLISLTQGIFLLILFIILFNLFPISMEYKAQVLPEWSRKVMPERELLYYRLGVFFVIGMQIGCLWTLKKFIKQKRIWQKGLQFLSIDALLLVLILLSLMRMVVYDMSTSIKVAFSVLLVLAGLYKLFWPEVLKAIHRLSKRLSKSQARENFWMIDAAFLIFIGLLIFVPDRQGVLAKIYQIEQLYHIDSFVMAPGWALLNGLTLNVDIISRYGLGVPIILTFLSEWIGGFGYENVLTVMMVMVMVYFMYAYIFLRQWVKWRLLSMFGILLMIKIQMFHIGVEPFIWRYPSGSVVRYFMDLVFLTLILKHIQEDKRHWLWAIVGCVGFTMFYMYENGIYQYLAFLAYLVVHLFFPHYRKSVYKGKQDGAFVATLVILPIILGLLLMWWAVGSAFWTKLYWQNTTDFTKSFLGGMGALPIFLNLAKHQIWEFLVGIFMPVFYVVSLVVIGSLCYFKKIGKEHIFIVVLCVYGLGTYHYYVCRSAVVSYYAVSVPYVILICYWIYQGLIQLSNERRRPILLGLVIMSMYALFVNESFINYPNVFNQKSNHFGDEKHFATQEMDWQEDIKLIQAYSKPEDRVPLVSSSEVKLLMEAERKPFFYFVYLVASQPMTGKTFGGMLTLTKKDFEFTIGQLIQAKPEYVFVERKLFRREINKKYYQHYTALEGLIQYLDQSYEVLDEGKYLLALKRK